MRHTITLTTAFAVAFATQASAQAFSVQGSVFPAGGGSSSGGGFNLIGAAGQPEGGIDDPSGGGFTVTGGFWAAGASEGPQPCNAADLVEPFGELDFFDIQALVTPFLAGDLAVDLNGDGELNFFDIEAFVNAFLAGCP